MRTLGAIATGILVLGAIIFSGAGTAINASSSFTRLYTSDADFDQGTLFNVNHNGPNSNQLQLDTTLTTFPIMWIANAGEDTLSKVDTDTGRELARYFTYAPRFSHINNAWAGPAPSRTAVDADGNAYVANRHFDGRSPSVMKVLAEGFIDRNGNGTMETSNDTDGNGIISAAEMLPIIDANGNGRLDSDGNGDGLADNLEMKDERIAWVAPIGPPNGLGRSLCLGTDGNLWVGMYSAQQYWKMSSATGATLAGPVSTPGHTPYGCVVDVNGRLWSASLGSTLGELDTLANGGQGLWKATRNHGGGGDYGIAIGNNKVYQSNSGHTYHIFDPATNSFSQSGVGGSSTGIAVDAEGNIIAGEFGGPVRKHSPLNALLWSTSAAGGTSGSHGTIVDSNGDVWRINLYSHNMTKYRGTDGFLLGVFPIGNSPYTYSDATGLSARNNTAPSGTWTLVQDSGAAGTIWTTVTWNTEPQGNVPTGASISVRARAADNVADLSLQAYTPVSNGQAFSVTGRYVQVQATLTANSDGDSPVLSDLTVSGHPNNTAPVAADGFATLDEDSTQTITLSASDVDQNDLTFIISSEPAHGTLSGLTQGSCTADGKCTATVTYTPKLNFYGNDKIVFAVNDGQADSNLATFSIDVRPVNDAPTVTDGTAVTDEDTPTRIALTGFDLEGDPLAFTVMTYPAHGTLSGAAPTLTYTPAPNYFGPDVITFKASDGQLASQAATIHITVNPVNDAPAVTAGGPYVVTEGGSVILTASGSDIEDTSLTYVWDLNNDGTFETPGPVATFSAAALDGPRTQPVAVKAFDSGGLTAIGGGFVDITNAAPIAGEIRWSQSVDPAFVNTQLDVSASFTDVGTLDTHTATWSWGDGLTSTGTVTESGGSGTVTGTHTYAAAGLYSVELTLRDDDGGVVAITYSYVVVVNPGGGSISGGGTVVSTAGAMPDNPQASGNADFTLVARYARNATTPTGTTSFNFPGGGGLSFASSSYRWLVVSGGQAWYRGTGYVTISGVSQPAEFLVAAVDGPNFTADKLRMKIWTGNRVIHDGQPGAPDAASAMPPVISGPASIVVR